MKNENETLKEEVNKGHRDLEKLKQEHKKELQYLQADAAGIKNSL